MRFYFIAALLLFCNKIKCQNYSSKWFDTDNDLPVNSIKDIIKDKYGFIWLSTEGGIIRYDGNSFKTYHDRLKKNNYHMMYFNGVIEKDSILIYNENEEDHIIIRKRTPAILDKNYTTTKNITLRNCLEYRQVFKSIPVNRKIYEKNYFLKLGGAVYYFNADSIEYGRDHKTKKIPVLFEEKHLGYIFSHGKILFVPDFTSRKVVSIQNGSPVLISADPLYTNAESKIYWHKTTGQVFLTNNGKLYRSRLENGNLRLELIMNYEDLKDLAIYSIYQDETFGKIYIGTISRGLNVITLSNFHISKRKRDNIYYSFLPYGRNSVIIPHGDIFNSKSKIGNAHRFKEDYENISMTKDDAENIFCINNFKLHKLHRSTGYATRSILEFNKKVSWVSRDRDFYFLGISDLKSTYLYVFKNSRFGTPDHKFKLRKNANIAIQYDKEHLLVGCNDGLYVVSLHNGTISKTGNDDINVKNIIHTSTGHFWIMTNGSGLYLYKSGKLIKMPDDLNRNILSAHTILEDRVGTYWIPTNNGLFKVKEDLLLKYSLNSKTNVPYYRFGKQDGLSTNEFNGGSKPCGAITSDRTFVLPSMDGLTFFRPDSIKMHYPDRVFIERVKVNDAEEMYFNKTLFLENSSAIAVIYFDIPYFGNIDNVYLEAKIDGYSGWSNVGKERSITIKNIDPGKYTMTLRYINSPNGKYSYKTIKITVGYLFYQTAIFQIAVAIMILSLIVYIIQTSTRLTRMRTIILKEKMSLQKIELNQTINNLATTEEKLKNESDHRIKILESINHDISTPIKYLSILSQKLFEAEDLKTQKIHLSNMHKYSEQLYNFTLTLHDYDQLYMGIDNDETEVYSLNDLLDEKIALFEGFALSNNTHIHNNNAKKLFICVRKEIISVILHNILDNAVKYTKNGNIFVETRCANNWITINVSDTGMGMSQKQVDFYNSIYLDFEDRPITFTATGYGLRMIIELVKKIEGKISFSKNNPKGTIATIRLKHNYDRKKNTYCR